VRFSKRWTYAFNHPFRTNWHWFHFVYLGWDTIVPDTVTLSLIVMGFGVTFCYDRREKKP
jgi:hypothetical protein